MDNMHSEQLTKTTVFKDIDISSLKRGIYQPRQEFNPSALESLAQTIRKVGILQPLLVRPHISKNFYEIIAGERRWRAAQLAGLHQVPCLIVNFTDQQAAHAALIENDSRENLNPIEEALGYKKLIDEFNYTHETLGALLGKTRTAVTNKLRLLELDARVQELLRVGQLSPIHGRLLAGVASEKQYVFAVMTIKNQWSTRILEKAIKANNNKNNNLLSKKDLDLRHLEQELTDHFGYNFQIQAKNKGRWQFNIHFENLDQAENFLRTIGYDTKDADSFE